MVSSWFLSLMALSCCVCGIELNVAHSSYQAEEEQSVTLDWTFTPDPSLKDLYVHCDMWSFSNKHLDLLLFSRGVVHSESVSEEFSGRVQFDKDALREGRLRLHVSSLRTQDSGWYFCEVATNSGSGLEKCQLNVTAAVDKPEPQRLPQRPKPELGAQGIFGLYIALSLAGVAALFGFYMILKC